MPKGMKVSLQMSKDGSTTHNSRNFDLEKAEHIDPSRTHLNHYTAIYPELKHDFTLVEKKFYAEQFKDWIAEKKANAKKHRHPERAKTAEQLRTNKRTSPEEIIYQLGDLNNAPTSKEFRQWMQEIIKYHYEITKGHCQILDSAIHNDEYSPHAHVRQVWTYLDTKKDGTQVMKIGKDKALEAAGIPLPDPTKPKSRYNNRQMTYTRMMREKAESLAREMGFEIDTTRSKRKHLNKEQYIEYAMEQERKQYELHERRAKELQSNK